MSPRLSTGAISISGGGWDIPTRGKDISIGSDRSLSREHAASLPRVQNPSTPPPAMTQQRGEVVKLFVGQIPKTLEEDGVREVFQEFGEISEIVILRDRRTGMHQVRLADAGGNTGDRGQTNAENKLFVGGVPTGCGDKDLRALFSTYGEVLDVYILASKASQEGQRGCAFVRYSSLQSCAIAIEALHGKYAMKAGELPLVVRFADPPKNQRANGPGNLNTGGNNGRYPWPSGSNSVWPTGPPPSWSFPWALGGMAPWMMAPGMLPPGMTSNGSNAYGQFPFGTQQGQNLLAQQQQQQVNRGATPPPPPLDNPAPTGGVPPPLPPPAPAAPVAQTWTEHQTPEGLKYYYNSATGTSTWDCPPELRPGNSAPSAPLPSANSSTSLVSAIAALGLGTPSSMSSLGSLAGNQAPASNAPSQLPSSLSLSGNGFQGGIGSSVIGNNCSGVNFSSSNSLPGGMDSLGLPGLGSLNNSSAGSTVVTVHELPPKVSSQDLRAIFSQYGKITFSEMNEGTNSGRVGFESPVSAANAISMMNGLKLPGDKKLLVLPSGLTGSMY